MRVMYFVAMLALLACGPACTRGAPAGAEPVTVLAAASLTEVIEEAADSFSRASGRPVRASFGASSTLARQIREGAPADVFVSADREWLDVATPTARFDWLGNRMACVVPADRGGAVDLSAVASLAIGGEQVPAGRYARNALQSMGIRPPPRTIHGASVRDVLSKVAEGAADAGVVYATDVPVDPRVRLALLLPEDSHPPIRYAAGLLRPGGREFFEALRAPALLEAARRRGFTTPP